MKRITALLATLLLTALLAACGGGDGDSEGDAPDGGTDDGAASTSAAGDNATRVTSDDGDLVLVVPDGAPEVSATKTDSGWELLPDGATFDEPLVVELEVAVSGNGLPLAILESADGTRELPAQVVEIKDGRASFRVLVPHFSELTVEEAETGSAGGDGVVTLRESVALSELLDGETDIDVGALLRGLSGEVPSPATLPEGDQLFVQLDQDVRDILGSLEAGDGRYAVLPDADEWVIGAEFGPTAVLRGPGGLDTAGVLVPTRAGPAIEGTEEISGVTVRVADGGLALTFAIPAGIDYEPVVADGGSFVAAVTGDTAGGFVESSIGLGGDDEARVVVFDFSGLQQDKQDGPPNSTIDGANVEVFFPISLINGQPTATVNDQEYPLTGMRIDTYVRDAAGENVSVGSVVIDFDALDMLLLELDL